MRVLVVIAAAAALLLPAAAHASSGQESILMDDPKIVYSAPERLDATLADVKRLGVDRIRVSVFWGLLAPDPHSESRPWAVGSGANPANYSSEKWDRFDRIVTSAQKIGLKVLFSITSPAPLWATGDPPRPGIEDTFRPSASEFHDFVKALGTRYSGSFRDEAVRQGSALFNGPCDPVPTIPLPPAVCPEPGNEPPATPNPPNTGPILPRVNTWSIWNEPNHAGWLTPQWSSNPNGGAPVPAGADVYRGLADAAYAALGETGHGQDRILLAETAPRGSFRSGVDQGLRPLKFVRELYCLSPGFKPYTGDAAKVRNCPSGGSGFVAAHPVLFNAAGWAHHPYAFEAPPGRTDKVADHAVLADLGRLSSTLDRAFKAHRFGRKLKIWLTEYGYQTDPPDPYVGISYRTHEEYLAEAEWMTFRNGRIASTAQFLLVDDAPLRQYPSNDPRYWGTFQSGLRTSDGKRKISYGAYQRTIHVVRRGGRVTMFGAYRPATGKTPATFEFRRRGTKSWHALASTKTNSRGFVVARLRAGRGSFRIAFRDGNSTLFTRTVSR